MEIVDCGVLLAQCVIVLAGLGTSELLESLPVRKAGQCPAAAAEPKLGLLGAKGVSWWR